MRLIAVLAVGAILLLIATPFARIVAVGVGSWHCRKTTLRVTIPNSVAPAPPS
jgi:hypothetical protein